MTQPVCIECLLELKDERMVMRCEVCLGLAHISTCYKRHLERHQK